MFALCGSSRVRVLPRLDVAGVDGVAFKIAGNAHAITTAIEPM